MVIIKSVLKLTTSTANNDKLAMSVHVYVKMNVIFMLMNCISDLVYRIITPSVSIGNLEVVFNEL